MPSTFRNRLTRRQAAPSSSLPSSSSSSPSSSSSVGAAGRSVAQVTKRDQTNGGYGIIISGKSFLGRQYSVGGGTNTSTKQKKQQQQQQQQQHSNNHTNYPLAAFDACIEACDALAASSASTSPWQKQLLKDSFGTSSTSNTTATQVVSKDSGDDNDEDNDYEIHPLSSNEKSTLGGIIADQQIHAHEETHPRPAAPMPIAAAAAAAVPDCSVLVSPDGALLFTSSLSTLANPNNNLVLPSIRQKEGHSTHPHDPSSSNSIHDEDEDAIRYPWTKLSPENCDGAILAFEDYESAVVAGNDLSPRGDRDSNGFSSAGWSVDAASRALAASRDALADAAEFAEALAASRTREAARVRSAAEGLRRPPPMGQRQQEEEDAWAAAAVLRSEGKYCCGRKMGPMASPETKLSAAMEALEEYYVRTSDGEIERWNLAAESSSSCSHGTTTTTPSSSLSRACEGTATSSSAEARSGNEWRNPSFPEQLIHGMLPKLQTASAKAASRTSERERALAEMRSKLTECETILREQKVWASSQWKRVAEEEANIDRLYAIKKMEQNEFYEDQRRRRLREKDGGEDAGSHSKAEETGDGVEEEGPLSKEVWEMVQNVNTSMEDFGHTGYSPRAVNRKSNLSHGQHQHPHNIDIPSKTITRADVERESDIQDLKMVAQAAEEAVEDAAGKLLNIMSKGDTTLRSARLAAESCLLSECNAARNCLRSLVAMERASLQDRLLHLDKLEAAVNAINVRKDIDNYIRADKALPGGRSREGEDDGGGIAAALAVLNSHGENNSGSATSPRKYRNIERPSYFEGWVENEGGDDSDGDEDVDPEIFGEVVDMIFNGCPPPHSVAEESDSGSGENSITQMDIKIEISSNALRSKRGNNHRKSILYELNNQRSKKTWVEGRPNFDALCRIFDAFLSGCGREPNDVSNAMMLMILSQTFYIVDHAGEKGKNDGREHDDGSITRDRKSRIYVKSTICHHEIWSDEDFWDQAAYQCVSESLSKSGVLLNYVKSATGSEKDATGRQPRTIKWHDLSPDEYAGAASQVHSVLFAQLGTLSHSMLELGCGVPRACNFVRRLSIRYQLPLSLRGTLIQHLMKER